MKIDSKAFTTEQLLLLKAVGIVFKDGYDYSDDDYISIEDKIVDNIIDSGLNPDGTGTPEMDKWEDILDVLQREYDK